MHPLTLCEIDKDCSFDKVLQSGLLPKAITSEAPWHYLKSYVSTYLREEVLQESLTRNLALFTNFLECASFSQGEALNYTAIAREIGSNRQTIMRFFDILDDLLIAIRLPVFKKRAKRRLQNSPKFYFFDVGIYRTLRPQGPLDSTQEIDGPALKTLLLQNCRALNDYYDLDYNFYFWRKTAGAEVDLILYGPNGFNAIEIKRKSNLSEKDFSGLNLFAKDHPEAKCYCLYGGERAYHHHGIDVIPYKSFLKSGILRMLSPS